VSFGAKVAQSSTDENVGLLVVGGVCGCHDAHRLHVGGWVRGAAGPRARPWVSRWVAMRTVVRILMIVCMLLAALAIS